MSIFKYLTVPAEANKPQGWQALKESLQTLVAIYPESSYAADAKLWLAWGKASEENERDGAVKDLRAIIAEHPDTPTVVEGPPNEPLQEVLDPNWVRFTSVTRVLNPDGTATIRPFPKSGEERFDEFGFNEARRYFEHLERFPRKAGDVAHLMIAALFLKDGRKEDAATEFMAIIQSYEDPESALRADRRAGDEKYGYLIAIWLSPLSRAYYGLFRLYAEAGEYNKALAYGTKLADWRGSEDGRAIERLVADTCVKAKDFEKAELYYKEALGRFMRNAHKKDWLSADRVQKTKDELQILIKACHAAKAGREFAIPRPSEPKGPYAPERMRCDRWPPDSKEEREKLGISEIDEERLGTDQGHLLNGQRLWLWATLDLLMKEGFRPDLKRTLSLENWPAARNQTVVILWSAKGYSLQARREVRGDPGTFILIVPEKAQQLAGLDESRRVLATLDFFLSDRFQIKSEDTEQPVDGHKVLTYEFKDGIAFMKFGSRPEQDVSAEIRAWCAEDRIVLKVSDPVLREARAESAMRPGYPPAKLLSLTASLANLPEADEGRALFENLGGALKRNSKTAHEQLKLLLAHGGPWAFIGAVGAVCVERSDNAQARAIGAKAVVDMMANLAIPASPLTTEEEKLVIQQNIEALIANQKEPQGEAYASAKTVIQEAEGRATPFLLDALKKDPPRPVKETICELIDRCGQLDQLAEVVKACAAEPDGDLRSRMIDASFGAKIRALQEKWDKYVESAGDGKMKGK
ncbi:MAG TPA: hypothetical protein VM163_14120 [bacterium]|nr:hypothetical protein [bacterium]